MKFSRICLSLFLGIALLLSGCATPLYYKTSKNISNVRGQLAAADIQNSNQPSVVSEPGMYVNATPIRGGKTPYWMKRRVTIRGHQLPFDFYVEKILAGTPVNVGYLKDMNRSLILSINYSGTVKGALQKLAERTGYAYTLNGNDLTWSDMIARTFNVSFMPGSSDYLVGGAGTRSGNAANPNAAFFGNLGNTRNQYSTLVGSENVWKDLTDTLNELKSKQGRVMVSESTTTVTVYDHPRNVEMMAQFIKELNKQLAHEVALQVRVLQIELNKNFNYGIDWNLVRKVMGVRLGLTGALSQPVTVNPLGNNGTPAIAGIIVRGIEGKDWEGTNVLINALKQQGNVSVVTEPRVVTLNNQVAEIGIAQITGYLKEVSVTFTGVNANVPTQALTPGEVKTGFLLYILPKIKHNKVFLQISNDISRLRNIQVIRASQEPNAAEIQVPTITEQTFNEKSLVPSGDTLIIAGFKQLTNEANNTRMYSVPSSQGVRQNNIETIILITPTILS